MFGTNYVIMETTLLTLKERTNASREVAEAIEIPFALDRFIQNMGITDTTAWRWRKRGWLNTRNIAGRVYILPKDLREFNRRMEAGDFAQDHKAPKRTKRFEY